MRICILTTSFPLHKGITIGSHVIEQVRHLVKLGVDVDVLAPHHKGAPRHEIMAGISVYRIRYIWPERWQTLCYGAGIPTNLEKSVWAKVQLPFLILMLFINTLRIARKSDLIHCHWSIAGLVGVMAGKLLNKKVVLMVHGAEFFVLGDNLILRFLLKHIDLCISNSTFTESKALEVYPVTDHVVIPPGIDIHRFYPQRTVPDLRNKLNISNAEIFVLAIGKFIPRKGFEYLIDAFNIIVNQKKMTHIKLRIGGRGPLKPKYEKMIDQYALTGFIDFLEYIKDDQMPSYYTEADVFVLPSIVDERGDTEGLGVVFLEASACQTAVIGSRVGGIMDVIKDGENGYFVEQKKSLDLAEKIIRLANDEKLRKQMGQNGRRIVKNSFNWNHLAKRIIDVYESVLI
jgi:glycosyltransferase involved in cell wall biosynthesis